MRLWLRMLIDKVFTNLSALSIVLMAAALCIILGPMIGKGIGAVFFRSTVEFRRMQFEMHGRGDKATLQKELADATLARAEVYAIIDTFRSGMDTAHLQSQVRDIYREYGEQLRYKNIESEAYAAASEEAKSIRDDLLAAFDTTDSTVANEYLAKVLVKADVAQFKDTSIEQYFTIAHNYRAIVKAVDLKKRDQYAAAVAEVQELIRLLLGPRPDQPKPALSMDQYGATRWDRANVYLDKLLWTTQWVAGEKGSSLRQAKTLRADMFTGTEMEKLFPLVERHLDSMLLPRPAVYWQYLIDDSTPGHFFGGIGPEIIGTFILTTLAMLFAFPLGVISSAYLVECGGDTLAVRIIRICINTLAGVPSIVFGLFRPCVFCAVPFPKIRYAVQTLRTCRLADAGNSYPAGDHPRKRRGDSLACRKRTRKRRSRWAQAISKRLSPSRFPPLRRVF